MCGGGLLRTKVVKQRNVQANYRNIGQIVNTIFGSQILKEAPFVAGKVLVVDDAPLVYQTMSTQIVYI